MNVAGRMLLPVRLEWLQRSAVRIFRNTATEAHRATTHSRRVVGLQRLRQWFPEHLVVLDCGEPIRRGSGEIVARAQTATLDEGSDTEFFQTGTGRDQGLATAACARVSVL